MRRAATAGRRSSASSSASTRPISRIASRPSRGRLPWAARPFGLDFHPLEALVGDGDGQVGRLGHDGAVGAPAGDERVGANARVLFVDDAGDEELPGIEASALGEDARGIDHRGHTALHVLRAAAVDPAVALGGIERPSPCRPRRRCRHGRTTSGSGPARRPSRTPTTFGRPGATSCTCTASPNRRQTLGERPADLRFTARAGHERRIDGVDGDQGLQQVDGRMSMRLHLRLASLAVRSRSRLTYGTRPPARPRATSSRRRSRRSPVSDPLPARRRASGRRWGRHSRFRRAPSSRSGWPRFCVHMRPDST